MKQCKLFILNLLLVGGSFFGVKSYAQLGFCSGNSGDPIFTETFGTGTTSGPQLPPGTTTYTYVNSEPNDGFYTVSHSSFGWYGWHNIQDHTPNDINGKMFIVNADFTAGEFFRRSISGLCENTSYEFSSWLLNLLPASGCSGSGIPINVRFEIWDNTDTTLLASGDTGSIFGTNSPTWEQYGLVFQTLPGQTAVVLKMINNGNGGCGNDLAIDDIVFKSCGDFIDVTDQSGETSFYLCDYETPTSMTLTANPDFSIFSTHAYQWQQSTDNTIWTDLVGETNQSYTTPNLFNTTYYRVKVAEDAVNLANDQCNTISDVFTIEVTTRPDAPVSNGDVFNCDYEDNPAVVTVPGQVLVNWYDAPSAGNLLLENSTSYAATTSGTYYAEAISSMGACVSSSRTAVTVVFSESPQVEDEETVFCEGDTVTLHAGIPNMQYLWNTGATSESISVTTGGNYSVAITNSEGCTSTKNILVTELFAPIIESVTSDGRDLIITTQNTGDFTYSIDGVIFQQSNVFNVQGGLYQIYVREENGCGIDTIQYIHFVIPKYFTPNGDTVNDTFNLRGIEYYPRSEVLIFDRYGKLLLSSYNAPFSWDGTFNNENLPADDYWYVIKINGQEFKGHFALIR